jgi:hypothetical protein
MHISEQRDISLCANSLTDKFGKNSRKRLSGSEKLPIKGLQLRNTDLEGCIGEAKECRRTT